MIGKCLINVSVAICTLIILEACSDYIVIIFHVHVGPPSSPSLVVAESFLQIIFVISPPLTFPQCVLNYIITATSSDGSVLPDITVPVTNTDEEPTLAARNAFAFCNNTYTFTVVANTLTGPGGSSRSVVITRPKRIDLFSEFTTKSL